MTGIHAKGTWFESINQINRPIHGEHRIPVLQRCGQLIRWSIHHKTLSKIDERQISDDRRDHQGPVVPLEEVWKLNHGGLDL